MSRRVSLPNDAVQTLLGGSFTRRGASFGADARYCRDLTRREAANFYWGFVALPVPQRIAIYALYSFARQVDDEADSGVAGAADAPERADQFSRHRERVRHCFADAGVDPVTRVLSEVVERYGIPQRELDALIDGMEMDVRVSRYETWEDSRRYCLLVASTVGRMCVRIFGYRDVAALEYADDLGIAMQLTNMLRDVREDMAMGRIYLPGEDLRAFGISEASLAGEEPPDEWESFIRFEVERARRHFDLGLRVADLIPRRAAACVLTMAGIYQGLLLEIERDPGLPLRGRASLGGKEKLAVALRSWLRAV